MVRTAAGLAFIGVLLLALLGCPTETPGGGTAVLVLMQGTTEIGDGGTYDFGGVRVGTSSADVVFSLSNTGDATFDVPGGTPFSVSGADATLFELYISTVPDTIAAGETVYFTLTFNPDSLGAKTATVTVPDDQLNEYTFTLTGTGTDAPAAATGLTVAYAAGPTVQVAWTDNSTNEDGFRVQRAVGPGSYTTAYETAANATSWDDTTVVLDTEYTYRVIAFNDEGNAAASNTDSIFTPPTAPTGVTTTATATNQLYVSWTDTSSTATQFHIERRLGAGAYSEIDTVTAPTTEYYDTGLALETGYTYQIRAYNGDTYSDYGTGTEVATLPIWTIEQVDTDGDVGQWSSIILDGNTPHISYYDADGSDLMHADRTGGTWSTDPVDTSSAGRYSAIAINASGYPVISYYSENYSPTRLAYAEYTGSLWTADYSGFDDSSADTGTYTDIAVAAGGDVHFSYSAEYPADLSGTYPGGFSGVYAWYQERSGTVWGTPELLSEMVWQNPRTYWTSIDVDTSGYPHIVWYEERYLEPPEWPHSLMYAYYDGADWNVETVETYMATDGTDTAGIGKYVSLVLDGDTPRISYYDDVNNNGDLRYAYRSGTWSSAGVDDGVENRGLWTSIAVGPTGYIHISYYDASTGDLRYAHYNGSSWSTEAVDSSDDIGQYTSIAVDSNGLPHISYYDATWGDLMYARMNPTE